LETGLPYTAVIDAVAAQQMQRQKSGRKKRAANCGGENGQVGAGWMWSRPAVNLKAKRGSKPGREKARLSERHFD